MGTFRLLLVSCWLVSSLFYLNTALGAGEVKNSQSTHVNSLRHSTLSPCPVDGLIVGVRTGEGVAQIDNRGIPFGAEIDILRGALDSTTCKVTTWLEYDSSSKLLKDVASGQVHIGIGGLNPTPERAEAVHLSIPTLLAKNGKVVLTRVVPWFNPSRYGHVFLLVVPIGLLLVSIPTLGWLIFEKEQQQGRSFKQSLSDATWFGKIAITTTGLGDVTMKSMTGRLVVGSYLLFGSTLYSSLVINTVGDAISAPLTTLPTVAYLKGAKVGVGKGSSSELFAKNAGAKIVHTATLDSAIIALQEGEVDAIMGDRREYEALKINRRSELSDFAIPPWTIQTQPPVLLLNGTVYTSNSDITGDGSVTLREFLDYHLIAYQSSAQGLQVGN